MRFRFTLNSETLGALILEKNPVGWNDLEILIKRGTDTHGFFYEQAVNLQFYCGAGKEYIDEVRSVEGIDAQIGINIEVACGCEPGSDLPDYSIDYSDDYGSMSEGDCQWEELYEGILDMKTWESEKNFTRVNIIESSFFQKVRNRLDTVVDLLRTDTIEGEDVTDTNMPYDLTLHSKAIVLENEVEMLTESYNESKLLTDDVDTLYFVMPFEFIEVEEFPSLSIPENPLLTSGNLDDGGFLQPIYINLTGEGTITDAGLNIRIVGNFHENKQVSRSYNLRLVYSISDTPVANEQGGTVVTIQDFGVKSPLAGVTLIQPVDVTVDVNVDIPEGYQIHVYWVLANYTSSVEDFFPTNITWENEELNANLSWTSVLDDSVANGYAVFEAGNKIAEVISDKQDAFRSSFLGRKNSLPFSYDSNGCGSFASIGSGHWMRGFPITGDNARTTKISLNTFYRSLSAIWNLGLGIEKINGEYFVVMERMDYFYDSDTVLLIFDNVPDIIIQEAEEYYTNRVSIGYSRWETEYRNGLEETNSKRFLELGFRAIDANKQIYSDLVTGGYAIESCRRFNYNEFRTTDTDYDEANFMICLNRTVDESGVPTMLDVAEKDENFSQVNNLLSPETSYNLRVTPYRNLLRHSDILNPALLKYAGREIKFMGGEANYKASTEFSDDSCPGYWNNELLNEGQNIQWDDTNNTDNNPLWIPEIATFSYPISFTDFKVLKNNPKGVILVSETSENHIPYFILEVKYVPGNGGLAEFKLLRAYQA